MDLYNLFHFFKLCIDSLDQLEIRSYAKIIGKEIVQKWFPIARGAFEEYKLDAESFSKHELEMLSFFDKEQKVDKIFLKLL